MPEEENNQQDRDAMLEAVTRKIFQAEPRTKQETELLATIKGVWDSADGELAGVLFSSVSTQSRLMSAVFEDDPTYVAQAETDGDKIVSALVGYTPNSIEDTAQYVRITRVLQVAVGGGIEFSTFTLRPVSELHLVQDVGPFDSDEIE